jgi:hypothetical protein
MSLTSIKVLCLAVLLQGCGQLSTVKTGQPVLWMAAEKSVKISSLLCNPDHCVDQDKKTGVHHFLINRLSTFLQTNYGAKVQPDFEKENFELHFIFITAYEQKIDASLPRNIYLMVYDQNKKELAQYGMAENFSSPMSKDYMELGQVEQEFDQFIHSTFVKPHFLAGSKP